MKNIILLTKPHTGTHTMICLLGLLGGAKVLNLHLSSSNSVKTVREAVRLEPDSVYVVTLRDMQSHRDSWFTRYEDEEAQERWIQSVLASEEVIQYLPRDTFFLNIDGPPARRQKVIEAICKEAGIVITPTMEEFIAVWPRLNAQDGGTELPDALKEKLEHLKADAQLGEYLRKHHNYDVNKGEYNGTRN